MIQDIREYLIKESWRGQFELVFGPGGKWSKLLDRCPGFRGTMVLRDTQNLGRYLTVTLWNSEEQRERDLADYSTDFASLKVALSDWIDCSTDVGVFRVLAEATVRPRSGAR